MTSMNDVLIDAERITAATRYHFWWTSTPAGGAFNIARTIRAFERGGWLPSPWKIRWPRSAAATGPTRRWSPPGDGGQDQGGGGCPPGRALRHHGPHRRPGGGRMGSALERAAAYVKAGADMIFAEAVTELDQYDRFKQAAGVPILANMTEFGKTSCLTRRRSPCGVDMVLYPERRPRRQPGRPQRLSDASPRRPPARRGRHHADPGVPLRFSRLPPLRTDLDRLFTQDQSTKE